MKPAATLYRFRYENGEPADADATTYGLEAVYENTGHGLAIVARVNEGRDWAAYRGAGCSPDETEESTLAYVARCGAKLSEEEARFYFPGMQEPYRD
jgi:hypothetical protein